MGCSGECCFGVMYDEWNGVCDFVVLSVVDVCVDYGGVNVFMFVLIFASSKALGFVYIQVSGMLYVLIVYIMVLLAPHQ